MNRLRILLTLVAAPAALFFGAACEQQSAAIVAPKYLEKKEAGKEAGEKPAEADPNPPSYFQD